MRQQGNRVAVAERLHLRRTVLKVIPATAVLAMVGCAGVPGLTGTSDSEALLREGEALYRQKRFDEAIDRFKQVIARDPLDWRAWLWLCRTYIVRLMWSDAIESGRKAFTLSPQGPEVLSTFLQALFGGGLEALNNGDFTQSIERFGEYLKLDSSNGNAWLNAGKAYIGNRQFADALQALVKALGLQDVNRNEVVSTLFAGGSQAFGARDYGSAVNLLREYVKQDPRNLQAYLTLAKSYWASGQRSGALQAITEALKLSPTNAEALQYLFKLR
jgi:tetratricopeptide (TPR) repeat protein